jgi:hypothetical protein
MKGRSGKDTAGEFVRFSVTFGMKRLFSCTVVARRAVSVKSIKSIISIN